MFFLNHRYFSSQDEFLSFEDILGRHHLEYFSPEVKVIIFFSHKWVNSRVADNGDCFAECKNQVEQIITGFSDMPEYLKYFGFFFDYSCIPQCRDDRSFPGGVSVARQLKQLLLVELYQTVTQSATLYLCNSNSHGYQNRIWIVMELLIALDRGIAQFPTSFQDDTNLQQLAVTAQLLATQTDPFSLLLELTDALECSVAEDKFVTQQTLYRYFLTRRTRVPIEQMNMAIHDIHKGLRAALSGNPERLEKHIAHGLSNWKSSIRTMGFDAQFRQQLINSLGTGA